MTTKTDNQGLTEQIENLVKAHIAAVRAEAAAAVQRAFAPVDAGHVKTAKGTRTVRAGNRRKRVEMAELAERFYDTLCDMPGEIMHNLAQKVGATSQELSRPVNKLKLEGRVRTVGERRFTRYFPLAVNPVIPDVKTRTDHATTACATPEDSNKDGAVSLSR